MSGTAGGRWGWAQRSVEAAAKRPGSKERQRVGEKCLPFVFNWASMGCGVFLVILNLLARPKNFPILLNLKASKLIG